MIFAKYSCVNSTIFFPTSIEWIMCHAFECHGVSNFFYMKSADCIASLAIIFLFFDTIYVRRWHWNWQSAKINIRQIDILKACWRWTFLRNDAAIEWIIHGFEHLFDGIVPSTTCPIANWIWRGKQTFLFSCRRSILFVLGRNMSKLVYSLLALFAVILTGACADTSDIGCEPDPSIESLPFEDCGK